MTKSTKFSPFVKQCFVTATVCFNVIGNTAAFGFPAVLLPQLEQEGSQLVLTVEQTSWLTSVMAIAMIAGNFIATDVMERYGRRPASIAGSIPSIVGWMTIVLATNFEMLFIGRILQGLSTGLSLPVRSVLIGEYTSPKHRGAFLTTISVAQSSGIFLAHLIGSFRSWQETALICTFFPFIGLIMALHSPESPSYLASKGKYDECRKVFRWLRGDSEEIELEELIEARMIFAKKKKVTSLKEVLQIAKKKEIYKPILLVIHSQIMMQFAGGTLMAAYSTGIIELVIGKGANANFWMITFDSQRIISNIIAIYLINKYRRRVMMFSTGALCVLSHLAISGFVYANMCGLNYAWWIGIFLIHLQFVSVGIGMVPLPNVINGEVLPLHYRGIGSTIGVVVGTMNTFIVLKTFPGLKDSIGLHGTYILYAGLLMYFLSVIWILMPETKGKTLQQIEDEFRGRPLKPEELEVRRALQIDERKMSVLSMHSTISFG